LLGGGHTSPPVVPCSTAHLNLHQEETITPRGVHCPACLLAPVHEASPPSWVSQAHRSRMLHMLACLPLLSQRPDVRVPRSLPPTQHPSGSPSIAHRVGVHSSFPQTAFRTWTVGDEWPPVRGARVITGAGALPCRLRATRQLWLSGDLPLGSRPADPPSTSVGVEACSTPVLNHTQQGPSTLHPMEYSLLQPRSAPEGTPVGGGPNRHCSLPCPFYTTMLCSAATSAADCEANSASLTWAPSIFGAAHFGR